MQYRATLSAIQAAHRRQQLRLIAASAAAAFTAVFTAKRHTDGARPAASEAGLRASVSAAAGDVSSLLQAGVDLGNREVIAILGLGETAGASVPRLRAGSLQGGTTVVVSAFPSGGAAEAVWQADLIQAGAARAVMLTPAAGNQLADVVRQGLDGAIADNLTNVLFGRGKYTLRPAARSQLHHLLYLLTVVYPRASADINGYTDNLPAPRGNRELSEERAKAVLAWLTAHGVAPGRLQASGHGSADPIAPNTPHGQPRNRRVVVLIDPAAGAPG
jgi:outer membrane protein OmpA-like peptidoglycan-associated protein